MKISLFNINNYTINTEIFNNFLHGKIVEDFISEFCNYVGAKYGCALNSATNAIFLCLENKKAKVNIPSIIPPVVGNAVALGGNEINFIDDCDWVGDSYVLHNFGNYKIIDSAQKVDRNQFNKEANDQDLMIFSFYPTKPVGSMDGGIIVSNDKSKIDFYREKSLNGMTYSSNNWDRIQKHIGWKMYMNSFQAQIAMNNLKLLDDKKIRLSKIREKYNQEFGLKNTSDHLYRIRINDRDKHIERLSNLGITCGIHYKCLHKNNLFYNNQVLPNSEKEELITLSIPFHENLSDEDLDLVIKQVKNCNFIH